MNDKQTEQMFRSLIEGNWTMEEVTEVEDGHRLNAFSNIRNSISELLQRDAEVRVPFVGEIDGDMWVVDECDAAALADVFEQAFGWYQPRIFVEQIVSVVHGIISEKNAPMLMNEAVVDDLRDHLVAESAAWRDGGQNYLLQTAAMLLMYEMGLVSLPKAMDMIGDYVSEVVDAVGHSEFAKSAAGGVYTPRTREDIIDRTKEMLEELRPALANAGVTWEDGDLDDMDRLNEIMDLVRQNFDDMEDM